jgi:nitrogen regulatory protein P-II 1
MKEIKALVKPFRVENIIEALLNAGYPNLTVTLSEGTANQKDTQNFTQTYFSITTNKVAKIVIVCDDAEVEKIVEIISSKGRTGNPGDGIIYVTEVEKVYSVKTGLQSNPG